MPAETITGAGGVLPPAPGRKKCREGAGGHITVFFALTVLLLVCFVTALTESVRIRAGKVYWQIAADTAAGSLEASYCRELFGEYGLLFWWPGKTLPSEEAEKLFAAAKDPSDGLITAADGLYPLSSGTASVNGMVRACDNDAMLLRRQMLEGAAVDLLAAAAGTLDAEAQQFADAEQTAHTLEDALDSWEGVDWESIAQQEEQGEEPEPDPAGEADTGADQTLFSQILAWIKHPVMFLILPPGQTVSDRKAAPEDVYTGIGFPGNPEPAGGSAVLEKAGLCEYVMAHTSCFTAPASRGSLAYETEYVLGGNLSDEDNLAVVIARLFGVRQGMNAAYLAGDPVSMERVSAIATAAVGWTGSAQIVASAEVVLVYAWSFAEAVIDLRTLMSGGKVPVMKTRETFVLTPENLGNFASAGRSGTETGMDYRGYLRILLWMMDRMALTSRMGGLIQQNLRAVNPAFRLDACVGEAVVAYDGVMQSRFLRIVPVPGLEDLYSFHAERRMDYE